MERHHFLRDSVQRNMCSECQQAVLDKIHDMGLSLLGRQDAINRATAAAFETSEGRKIIHCRGSITGADWDLENVIDAIKDAFMVFWQDDWLGHDLTIIERTIEGQFWHFQIPRPEHATS